MSWFNVTFSFLVFVFVWCIGFIMGIILSRDRQIALHKIAQEENAKLKARLKALNEE